MENSLISELKELEIRCMSGNFDNFDIHSVLKKLKSHSKSTLNDAFESIVNQFSHQKHKEVLEVPLTDIGLTYSLNDGLFHFEECSESEQIASYVKQLILLFVGISSLQEFVRANISGPCGNEELPASLYCEPLRFCTEDENIRGYLCKDSDFSMSNVLLPGLLYLSSVLLSSAGICEDCCITRKWWLLRCVMVHQRTLAEGISSMYDQMVVLLKDVLAMEWIQNEKHSSLLVSFYVECEHMYLYYQRVGDAGKFLNLARELTGLTVELSGAYGKRTRFQQKSLPQLFVKLGRKSRNGADNSWEPGDASDFPPDLQLQDDTLLDDVSFTDGVVEDGVVDLSPEEQVVLFGEYSYLKQSGAWDNLQQEEMLSYVNCMLKQRKVWSIYTSALVLRCGLEKLNSRCMDRTLRQLEALIACIRKGFPPFQTRAPFLYAVVFPMMWSLEKMLAVQLMSMGATKTALDIYKKLNLWEDLVLCYQLLGRTSSAVELIEERLKVKETPLLYCLLGDVLDDPKMYEKADGLSTIPNARSQRSLGYYYYKRKDYSACIPYFQRSVEINYLQTGVWFALGYAALQCEMYDLAAHAYRQVVMLDDDNFQAWNNLSHAYIKSNQKVRAYSSLQEALKCNYEEWRVWENFLLVCVDIGAFEDAIRAYHRIVDIKDKYVDVQVLEILVTAINKDVKDYGGSPASRLRNSVQQLFGRVTSKGCKEYRVYELYSMLLSPDPEESVADLQTLKIAMRYQQQATNLCSSNDTWTSDAVAFSTVLQVCRRYLGLLSSIVPLLELPKEKAENKTVVKLVAKSVLIRAEKGLINFQEPEKSKLQELWNSVMAFCNKIVQL